jgi:hypothetical protein
MYYARKTYGGLNVQIHIFLTSTLIGGEWSLQAPATPIPCARSPGIHCMGPKAGLDNMEKIFDPIRT